MRAGSISLSSFRRSGSKPRRAAGAAEPAAAALATVAWATTGATTAVAADAARNERRLGFLRSGMSRFSMCQTNPRSIYKSRCHFFSPDSSAKMNHPAVAAVINLFRAWPRRCGPDGRFQPCLIHAASLCLGLVRKLAGSAPGNGVERGGERLGDLVDLRLGDRERRRDLQRHAAQQPGDDAPLADLGPQPGPDAGGGGPGP